MFIGREDCEIWKTEKGNIYLIWINNMMIGIIICFISENENVIIDILALFQNKYKRIHIIKSGK